MAQMRARLAASKQTTHLLQMAAFSRKKLNEVESKEKIHAKNVNWFTTENRDSEVDNYMLRELLAIDAYFIVN
jgi:hypothetical protein